MSKKLKKHASLRGVSKANDEANQLTEFRRGQSASVTILTDFAALNRLGCRAHIRSLAMTQCAFTMAEILLSLTIIGVVAAITLPSLMANINERTWKTQRKALYARMSQAIAMMPQVAGYGTLTENADGSVTEDTAAEAFLTEGLSKVLKINNICDSEHLADCGVPTSYTNLAGTTKTWPKTIGDWNSQFVGFSFVGSGWNNDFTDAYFSYSITNTKAAAFETQNGETIALYYNPNCKSSGEVGAGLSQDFMCANFIYDLNGNKGPNVAGKDVGFITALYSSDTSVVAPMPLAVDAGSGESIVKSDAGASCTAQDSESRLPNLDEIFSMYHNRELVGIFEGRYWASYSKTVYQHFKMGMYSISDKSSDSFSVRCVKR